MTYIDVSKRKRGDSGCASELVRALRERQMQVSKQLSKEGWCSFDLEDLPIEAWRQPAFGKFFKLCTSDLLPDPYDPSGQRFRRYGKLLYQPDNDILVPIEREYDSLGAAKSTLLQGSDYQPEHGDQGRRLPAIVDPVLSSPELRALILADLRVGRWSGVVPHSAAYLVSVHIQRLEPMGTDESVITPNLSHRDGEVSTFVHLLERINVTGGLNGVTTLDGVGYEPRRVPRNEVLTEFELDKVGSGFAVDDRRVGHFLEGVRLEDPTRYGCRTAMLIDFSPSRWVYSNEL